MKNIVKIGPFAKAWICANESIILWTRTLDVIKPRLQYLSVSATIASDRDQGISGAKSNVFADKLTHQFLLVIHRRKHLESFGKMDVTINDKMVYAPTLGELEKLKPSL